MMQTNTKNSSRKGLDFGLVGLAIAFVGLLVLLIVFLVRKYRERKGKSQPSEPTSDINYGIDEVQTGAITIAKQKQIFRQIYEGAKSHGFNDESALAIAGQSCLETGRWKSTLAQDYNNIFGMKDGGAGQGIQNGAVQGFATYAAWEQSLQDYAAWCIAKNYPFTDDLTIEQHLQWLKSKKYFEDTLENYRKSVLSLIKELS